MLPAILTQQFLTRVVREFPIEGYIGSEILPLEPVPGLKTMWDIITKDAKLAPFVAINAESPLADKAGLERAFHELADVRIKERLDEDELISLRMPGEPDVVTGLAATQRASAERHIRRTSDRMAAQVNARVEWMRWQALQSGVISYDDGKVIFSVDFGIPAGQIITLTGTDRWSTTASADPLADIATWVEALRLATGRAPTRMYVGANVPGYLVANSSIRTLLTGTESVKQLLNPANILNFVGSLVGLTIQRYDTTYQNTAGTDTRFLGANQVILMPEPMQADGEVLGDMATGPAKGNNFEPGMYAWVKEEEDPWATFVGAGIHAFPRLYHPGWITSVNTVGDS